MPFKLVRFEKKATTVHVRNLPSDLALFNFLNTTGFLVVILYPHPPLNAADDISFGREVVFLSAEIAL